MRARGVCDRGRCRFNEAALFKAERAESKPGIYKPDEVKLTFSGLLFVVGLRPCWPHTVTVGL